jgi:hypothetical protein
VGMTVLLFALTASAQNQQPANRANTIEPLPRDLEIQLALSSLPAHLRDHATVYVLNPAKGFEVGSNGTIASTRSSLAPAMMRCVGPGR